MLLACLVAPQMTFAMPDPDPAAQMRSGMQNVRRAMPVAELVRRFEQVIHLQNPNFYERLKINDRITIEYRARPDAARRLYRQELKMRREVLFAQAAEFEEMARTASGRSAGRLLMQATRIRFQAGQVTAKLERLSTNQLMIPDRVYRTEMSFNTPRQLEFEIDHLTGHGKPYLLVGLRRLPAGAVRALATARNGAVALSTLVAFGLMSAEAAASTRLENSRDKETARIRRAN